jgi:hypothetical protein
VGLRRGSLRGDRGTKVVDRQDVYVGHVDAKGRECDITIYPMMTVRHRVVVAPVIDDLL